MRLSMYTKLFGSITSSTIWQRPSDTRVVWITMLAMADKDGSVMTSIPGLARIAGVSLEACIAALEEFQSPDEYSRTKDYDGRRIAPIDGGFFLLNHAKYRAMRQEADRQEQNREAQARYRARHGKQGSKQSKQNKPPSSHTDASTDSDSNAVKEKAIGAYAPEFERFWQAYPRKVKKPVAAKAWKAMRLQSADPVLLGLNAQLQAGMFTQAQFTPHASSYLNARQWEDAPEPRQVPEAKPLAPSRQMQALQAVANTMRPHYDSGMVQSHNQNWPDDRLLPKP